MTSSEWFQLLIPVIGIVTAVVSASASYYFTKKLQIKTENQKLKTKYYEEFFDALSYQATTEEKEGVDRTVIAINKLPLICSSEVMRCLEPYKYYTSRQNTDKNIETENQLYTELIKAIRKDLYRSKVNSGLPIITMQGNKTVDGEKHEA